MSGFFVRNNFARVTLNELFLELKNSAERYFPTAVRKFFRFLFSFIGKSLISAVFPSAIEREGEPIRELLSRRV
jgi:hypothetical protein